MGSFNYKIGEKEDVLFCVFSGKMEMQSANVLLAFLETLKAKEAGAFILSFRDTQNVLPQTHTLLVKIQKHLREKKKKFFLCDLRPDIRSSLVHAGVIREAETCRDALQAWKQIKNQGSSVSAAAAAKMTGAPAHK